MISKPKSRSHVVAALRVFLVNGAGPRVSADKSAAEPDHCDKHHKSVCVCVCGEALLTFAGAKFSALGKQIN